MTPAPGRSSADPRRMPLSSAAMTALCARFALQFHFDSTARWERQQRSSVIPSQMGMTMSIAGCIITHWRGSVDKEQSLWTGTARENPAVL
jgi:hypothetical protein